MTGNPVPDEFSPILEVLRDHPLGMSIKEIAAAVSMSRNSVAKYLDVLTVSGQLELRHVGNAKLYSLSVRVPVGDILNHARELIIVLDNDLRVIQTSGSFCRFAGISREQILHARLSSLPLPLLSVEEEQKLVALLSGGSAWKKEIQVMRNGLEVWFDGRFIPTVLENGVPGITLILEDATERRLARKASIERDRLLHTIFQIPTTPQFFIDRNHKVVYWDRALEILTGIKAEEVVGTSDHWRAFYAHPHPCLIDLLVDGNPGAEVARQYQGRCPAPPGADGKYECTDFFPDMVTGPKWLHITSSLIRDTTGTVTGAMETIENVSDRNKNSFIVQK